MSLFKRLLSIWIAGVVGAVVAGIVISSLYLATGTYSSFLDGVVTYPHSFDFIRVCVAYALFFAAVSIFLTSPVYAITFWAVTSILNGLFHQSAR